MAPIWIRAVAILALICLVTASPVPIPTDPPTAGSLAPSPGQLVAPYPDSMLASLPPTNIPAVRDGMPHGGRAVVFDSDGTPIRYVGPGDHYQALTRTLQRAPNPQLPEPSVAGVEGQSVYDKFQSLPADQQTEIEKKAKKMTKGLVKVDGKRILKSSGNDMVDFQANKRMYFKDSKGWYFRDPNGALYSVELGGANGITPYSTFVTDPHVYQRVRKAEEQAAKGWWQRFAEGARGFMGRLSSASPDRYLHGV